MNYKLIKPVSGDIDILIKYKLNSIFEYVDNFSFLENERINNYIKTNIPKQLSDYRLIAKDNEIIGCVLVEKYEDGYLLDEIYIEKKFRNQGIGSDIIKNILNNKLIVYLWVYKNNEKAFRLYSKFGFYIIYETDTRYFMKCDK